MADKPLDDAALDALAARYTPVLAFCKEPDCDGSHGKIGDDDVLALIAEVRRMRAENAALQRALAAKIAPGEGKVEPCPHCGKPWWTVQVRCGCTALGTPPDGPSSELAIERLTYSLAAANARADAAEARLAAVVDRVVAAARACIAEWPHSTTEADEVLAAVERAARGDAPPSHAAGCVEYGRDSVGYLRSCVPECPTATAKRAREGT